MRASSASSPSACTGSFSMEIGPPNGAAQRNRLQDERLSSLMRLKIIRIIGKDDHGRALFEVAT